MALRIDSSLAPETTAGARSALPSDRSEGPRFTRELARAEKSGARATQPIDLVQPVRTPLATREAALALRRAWEDGMGRPPSEATLSVLVGQWAHETGRGQSMLNYNFGGIKGVGPSGMSTVYGTREGWGENEVRIRDRFRAYASAEEGAADYLSLLARRYPEAVRAAEAGDPSAFVQALQTRGYFTGNAAQYERSVTSLAREALASHFGAENARATDPGAPRRTPAAAPPVAELLAAAPLSPTELAPSSARPPAPPLAPELSAGASYPEIGAFYDEVNRAALLSSALRIARAGERRS